MQKLFYILTLILLFSLPCLAAEEEPPTTQELQAGRFGPVTQVDTDTPAETKMPEIEIKGDWIYVDGERFLVKGVGYSGWRPHELPWQVRPDGSLMENDFKLISEAGFNALRTWTR